MNFWVSKLEESEAISLMSLRKRRGERGKGEERESE